MTKNSLSEIRHEFLDFFSKRGHDILSSSSLVPNNDDTLLFTNAGMVQFKNIFTGIEKPSLSKRAVTAQKCVRAGGKHNDLENVGLTKRHHTFFEMLGNFSFGDYFKEEAISMAWELITKNYCIDPNRIIVTVYHDDEEAYKIWKKVSGFNESKILKINTNDNFWEMGESGPCGPCSEIFFDHGSKYPGGLPGSSNEGDRYVEIWNLVFMQYNKLVDSERERLPKPSIDTGMGIERIAAVLQGTSDNYDTDLFKRIINNTKEILNLEENNITKIPLRIISDHLRAACFLISDGVLPSNEGRGYVLRRILRRAIRHIYNLNIKEPCFFKLVPVLLKEMGSHYNELKLYEELITKTLKSEEEKFLETLEKGLRILEEENKKHNTKSIFSGKVAFKLYDTYGFPLDLTEDVLKNSNKKVDRQEFKKEMLIQKENSKKSWKGSFNKEDEKIWNNISKTINITKFLGYEIEEVTENVKHIIFENKLIEKFDKINEKVSLIFNSTPFYPEGGGQVGDTGTITGKSFTFEVIDTKKRANKIIEHLGVLKSGSIKKNDLCFLVINKIKRSQITSHHSATHLLHASLRNHLGKHVTQKGSLVSHEKLRFDISHNDPIPKKTIIEIEKEINNQIFKSYPIERINCKKDKAIEMGAMAIFGEKYGEKVRVVKMGKTIDGKKPYSVELCGGTHVQNTSEIGIFKILSETSLASGIRRIEAIAGSEVHKYFSFIENSINELATLLKVNKYGVMNRVTKLLEEKKILEKKVNEASTNVNDDIIKEFTVKNFTKFKLYYNIINSISSKKLKNLVDSILQEQEEKICLLIALDEKKATILIGVTKTLSKEINAVDLVRKSTPILGGKGGGGRDSLAQGGGTKPDKAKDVIEYLINYLEKNY